MKWEALWSQYSVKVKTFRQKLNHGGITSAKKIGHRFNMRILHLIQKITVVWKDTMCKNDDGCLKIPNKYTIYPSINIHIKISTPITSFFG